MTETCGNCRFGLLPADKDFTKRECHGLPPQLLVFPHPQGAQVRPMFPLTLSATAACGLYKPKEIKPLDKDALIELK